MRSAAAVRFFSYKRYIYSLKRITFFKCRTSDSFNAITNRYIRQTIASVKRIVGDIYVVSTNNYFFKTFWNIVAIIRTSEHITKMCYTAAVCFFPDKRDSDACQSGTVSERTVANPHHVVRNSNARQPTASCKCRITNTRHAVGNSYAG